MKVHVWVPELSATKGGIQTFSAHLLAALQTAIGSGRIRVFSKNDIVRPSGILARETKCVSCGRWPKSVRTPAFAASVAWGGWRDRPHLVIATHLNFSVAARWLKRLTGAPYWCVAHGIEAWDLRRPDRVAGLRAADRILAVSTHTRERLLREQALPAEQVQVFPNTFDDRRFTPGSKPESLLQRFGIKPGSKIILTVARLVGLERQKGYDQILRALPRIREAVPEAHYVLAGTGPDHRRIEQLIAELRLEGFVTLAGYVRDEELVDFYNLCDVFAMPGKGEGFGIVYLEALACGKPVLAGNRDGSTDALLGGELGVLVDPDNVPEISQALIEILTGRHALAILRQPERLRARVIETYGFDRFAQRVAELLAGHGAAASGHASRRIPVPL